MPFERTISPETLAPEDELDQDEDDEDDDKLADRLYLLMTTAGHIAAGAWEHPNEPDYVAERAVALALAIEHACLEVLEEEDD